MSRRNLLLASTLSSGGGGVYILHLTPQGETVGGVTTTTIEGDFSDLFNFLYNMCVVLGGENMDVRSIPDECNITVDGVKLSNVFYDDKAGVLNVEFQYIFGSMGPSYISLDKM